jgi:hypothetical protein
MSLSSSATTQSINGLKTYRLGSVGNLEMTVPSNWQDVFKTLDKPSGVTLAYHLSSKKDFYMKVTAVWIPPERRSSREAGWVRRTVEESAHELAEGSSKTDPTLIEIRSANGSGYYFQLPHKDKLPIGEFSYVTEGILDLGEVTFVFTTFSTSKDLTEIADSLRVVESARFVNTSGATQQFVGPERGQLVL